MSKELKINWVEDVAAMAVANRLGLKYTTMTISPIDINRGKSSENRARDVPLNEPRLAGIFHSMECNIPIPMVFVRVTAGDVVVAGGNHRFNAIPTGSVKSMPVHATECTDKEFEVLCRALNTVVGDGMTNAERLRAAVHAVEKVGMSQKEACDIYGIAKGALVSAVRRSSTERRLKVLAPIAAEKLTPTHLVKLGDLGNNDNVLKAAAMLVARHRISHEDFQESVSKARGMTTEADQVAVFEQAGKTIANGKAVSIPRKTKKKFATALSGIESLAEKTTWEALEIDKSEVPNFVLRMKKLKNYVDCLLKDDGSR